MENEIQLISNAPLLNLGMYRDSVVENAAREWCYQNKQLPLWFPNRVGAKKRQRVMNVYRLLRPQQNWHQEPVPFPTNSRSPGPVEACFLLHQAGLEVWLSLAPDSGGQHLEDRVQDAAPA